MRDRGWPQIRQVSSASSRGAEEAGGTNDVVVEGERLLPDGSFGRELLADRRQLVSHVRMIGSCTSKRSRRRSRQRSRPLRYFPPDPLSCSPDAPADLEGRATYHSDDQDLGCNLVAILALREGGSRRQLRGKSEGDGGDGHKGCEVEQHRLVVGRSRRCWEEDKGVNSRRLASWETWDSADAASVCSRSRLSQENACDCLRRSAGH